MHGLDRGGGPERLRLAHVVQPRAFQNQVASEPFAASGGVGHALGHRQVGQGREDRVEMGLQRHLRRCKPGLERHQSPSTGFVPVGLPSASRVIAATFSSASFSF